MKKSFSQWITAFLIAIPLAFVLAFFGFLPPRFDAVIYTNNIIGEGTSNTFISSPKESFAYLYRGDAYFGSELKTLRIRDLRYDIDTITLDIFDVKEADIISFDISIFNITVTHLNGEGITHPFTRTVNYAVLSDETPLAHIVLDKPDEGTSISVTGFDFIPVWFWISYFSFIVIISVLLSLLLIVAFERMPGVKRYLVSMATIMATMIMGCFLCGSLPYVDYTDFLLNWLLLFSVSLFINALTLPWVGTVSISVFTMLWYVANYFVITFRGKPIMPADIKAFSTAMEVINGYTLRPTWKIVLCVAVVIVYCIATIYCNKKNKRNKNELTGRICTAVVSLILFFGGIHTPAFASVNDFAWDTRVTESFHREGIVLSFLKNEMNSIVRKPDGYSREEVNKYLSEYKIDVINGIQPTNIIMVMNEAFSDLRSVGMDERIDVMPFIDGLKENTIKEDLYVSVNGGGTCNTEFEALTGNTLAFLGVGAYPYTSNVTKPLFSLASYFETLGYITEAFHANKATNWNRNMVYPFLGFQQFHDIEDLERFAPLVSLHRLPADIGDYKYIINIKDSYKNKSTFLFNVTMQNHSGYEHFIDVEEDATVKEFGNELKQEARVYLSLIKASDDAFRQLVETYQNSDEPTMIIFFGDHQPGMSFETQSGIYNTVQSNLDYYRTKIILWTNYKTNEQHEGAISANYLPWLILDQGNFPMPPYVQMLGELYEHYPIISSQGVMDIDGNIYTGVAEVMDDPLIRKYQYIQYANLFDEIDPAWFAVQ